MANLPWTLSNVVLLKYIIDVAAEGEGFYRVAIALVLFVAFVVITNLCTTLFYEVSLPKQREKLYFAIYKTIYEKAAKMDYEAYDNPEYYNDLVLAMNSMNDRANSVLSNTQDILTNVIGVFSVIGGHCLSSFYIHLSNKPAYGCHYCNAHHNKNKANRVDCNYNGADCKNTYNIGEYILRIG